MCRNFETTSKVIVRLNECLALKQADITSLFESQTSVVDVMVNVMPVLNSMANEQLIVIIKEFGEQATPPVKVFGDEDDLNITCFLKHCHKYLMMKTLVEYLATFEKYMLPLEYTMFTKKIMKHKMAAARHKKKVVS